MADTTSDTKDGGSLSRPEQRKLRDEGSGALGTSKLVSGPLEPEPKDSGNPESKFLTPQWLLSKPGDSKPPASSGDPPRTPGAPSPGHGMNDAPGKDRWRNVEGAPQDPKRGRDWWRTISLERDADSSRRERWREEERESSNNLAPRRDRWKEGERDAVGDQGPQPQNRRGANERWPEMSPAGGRESGEPLRRVPSERWADTANRESNFDSRRDSKWSNRWGPDEKEREFRGKWGGDGVDKEGGKYGVEGGKDGMEGGGYHPRHVANAHNVVRDGDREREREREREKERERDREREREREREPDTSRHDRAWRPSFASRGRGETPHLGSTPPKMAPGFMTGRGRGEPYGVGFTVGRGRGNLQSGLLHGPPLSPIGSPYVGDKWDVGKENAFRYPRVKLLDIHRKCGILSFQKYPDGFTEVSQLTQSDPVEPMAFFQPDMEEEAILDGIRKGEIVSSGAVHNSASKDGMNRPARQDSLGRGRGRGRGLVGKEDAGFDGHREDDFFDKPGFGSAQGGDGSTFDKLAEARFADAEESWENRARMESSTDNDGAKDENSWRPGRDDGSWRRDSGARSDGSWRKSRAGDEGTAAGNKEERAERQDRMGERDDRSSWRRPEQDESKAEHGVSAEKGVGMQEARRSDLEANLQSRDGAAFGGKSGSAEDQASRNEGYAGVEVGKDSQAASSKEGASRQETGLDQVAPEDLCLFYTDPQGEIQGPFLGVDIIGWFDAGYFELDLPVRLVDAPEGTPFIPLENVMPHLKPAVKVPPGFNSLKQAEEVGESSHMRGDVHSSSAGFRGGESSGGEVELKRGGGGLEPSLDIDLLGLSDTSKTLFGGEFQLGLNGRTSNSKVGYPKVAVDKHYANAEKEVGGKGEEGGEQASSMRRRMSAFPRVDTDVPEVLNLEAGNHFAQNHGLGSLPGQPFSASKAPRSSSMQADPSPMPQSVHGHGVPKEQAWGDSLLRNLSLDAQYPHVGLPPSGNGIDPTHLAQQLEHLELQHQHLQRMGSTGSGLQRQLSGVPPSPQSSRMNMEQLMRPGGPGSREQVLNPLLPQMPPQAHQAGVAIPPSGPVLEQLLRMQQQQQQQQQLPTQVLIEQLLRNQPMPPPAHFDHLHRQGSGLADQLLLGRQGPDPRLLDAPGQHLSGREFDQLLLGRQNHTSPSAFEQHVRQRQQEELQSQMLPFGLPVPQPHQSLEDMRVSGVWEVDEYGQFVKRTQSPAPLRTFEAFQQQQLQQQQQQQQQQQRLQSQLNFPAHFQHEAQDAFGFEAASLMDAGLMEHRVPMNTFDGGLLRRERSASGLSGMGQMDGDLVAQIQEQQQRSRGERQSNVPAYMESPGVFSDLDRFHRDVFDLRQVQERQQQVEAAAAARVLGLGTNTGVDAMEGRPKSGERRMGQVEGPGNSSLLSGLRWPLMNNEAPERQEMVHERNVFPPSLGLWGQESHEYGVHEHLMQGGGRNGAAMSDHVPIAAKASAGETPRSSSVASTPPEVPHMLGNWNLSNLHSNDTAGETQSSEGHFGGGSVGALIQPGWKAAAVPKPKSLAEIQEEEAASRKGGEKTNVEAGGQSTGGVGAGSAGFAPWAAASLLQPKSLREIQEEEAKKAASQRGAAQEAGQLQSSAGTVGQKSPSSRGGDPPAWGGVSLNEKGSSLLDVGEEQGVAQVSRKSAEQEASGLNQAAVGQSTQTASQSGSVFDDSDFIEPKESKKSKKRAAKAKSTTPSGKSAGGGTVAEASPLTSSKSTVARSVQVEAPEESLAAPPPGPSLADFLHLGSEPAAASAQPLPAWSTTPSRQAKAAKSLKEIQEVERRAREEQERQNQILQASLAAKNAPPPSAKPITLMTRSGSGGAAWQRPGAATPTVQAAVGGQLGKVVTSTGSSAGMGSSRSKVGVFEDDDDLFWDYGQDTKMSIGAVKQAAKSEPLDFPSLLPGHGGGKPSVAVRSGGVSSLPVFRNATAPAAVVRASPTDFPSLSATSVVTKATATKAKNQGSNKGAQVSAEVKALRQWCESQLKKMNYNEDPDVDFSIVDFCISLPSVSEASDYLSQYISTLAFVSPMQVQAFKKEFVRRKEQLPGDGNVSSSDREDTDGLFGGSNGKVVARSKSGAMDMARLLKEDNNSGDYESTTPGSGKKKGKKGKKVVDPSMLGFSVTSNRIMMGEIHHIDD